MRLKSLERGKRSRGYGKCCGFIRYKNIRPLFPPHWKIGTFIDRYSAGENRGNMQDIIMCKIQHPHDTGLSHKSGIKSRTFKGRDGSKLLNCPLALFSRKWAGK